MISEEWETVLERIFNMREELAMTQMGMNTIKTTNKAKKNTIMKLRVVEMAI